MFFSLAGRGLGSSVLWRLVQIVHSRRTTAQFALGRGCSSFSQVALRGLGFGVWGLGLSALRCWAQSVRSRLDWDCYKTIFFMNVPRDLLFRAGRSRWSRISGTSVTCQRDQSCAWTNVGLLSPRIPRSKYLLFEPRLGRVDGSGAGF